MCVCVCVCVCVFLLSHNLCQPVAEVLHSCCSSWYSYPRPNPNSIPHHNSDSRGPQEGLSHCWQQLLQEAVVYHQVLRSWWLQDRLQRNTCLTLSTEPAQLQKTVVCHQVLWSQWLQGRRPRTTCLNLSTLHCSRD